MVLLGPQHLRRAARRVGPWNRPPRASWHRGADAHHAIEPSSLRAQSPQRAVGRVALCKGARRAWRSSASGRSGSESSRRSRRPGQFSLCNGVVDFLGFTGPRGDRPPRLAAIFACTTRSSRGWLLRPARATPRRGAARHPHESPRVGACRVFVPNRSGLSFHTCQLPAGPLRRG